MSNLYDSYSNKQLPNSPIALRKTYEKHDASQSYLLTYLTSKLSFIPRTY